MLAYMSRPVMYGYVHGVARQYRSLDPQLSALGSPDPRAGCFTSSATEALKTLDTLKHINRYPAIKNLMKLP